MSGEPVALGRTGLRVSRLCLGCMNFGGRTGATESRAVMKRALEAGVHFWDTANVYNQGGSEEAVGRTMAELGVRDQVVLATKVTLPTGPGPNDRGSGRRHILQQVDLSLRRLGTDWIDLYQLHRPDFETPLEETVETMDGLVRSGKIRHWGTSVFPGWRLAEAWWRAESRGLARPVCEQGAYNLLDRRIEQERLRFLSEYGIALIPWSPLAGGLLTGKYGAEAIDDPPPGTRFLSQPQISRARSSKATLDAAQRLVGLARQSGLQPIPFAVAWLLHQPAVTAPIVGPADLAQLESYLPALEAKLPPDLLAAVDEIVPPGTAVADFHNNSGWFVGSGEVIR